MTTRFQIGQTLTTIAFRMPGIKKATFGPRVPLLFDSIQPEKITLIDLVVKEHHKVNNEFEDADQEKTCDGFVLECEDGKTWHNQFPRASYSQTSDACDRQFNYAISTGDVIDDLISDENRQEIFTELGSVVIDRILRGISVFTPKNNEVIQKGEKVKSLDDIRQLNGLQTENSDSKKASELKVLLENIKQAYVAKYGNTEKFDAAVKEHTDFVEMLNNFRLKQKAA